MGKGNNRQFNNKMYNYFKNTLFVDLKQTTRIKYYDDLTDFFFSIKDLQHYNPQVFEEVVDNIDGFFDIYKDIMSNISFQDRYLQIAESKKFNAVNALHSMIFSIPANSYIREKLVVAHERLETLMTKYLNDIYSIYRKRLGITGPLMSTRPVNTMKGPKPHNFYFDTYQFY